MGFVRGLCLGGGISETGEAAWNGSIKVWDLDMNNGDALVKRFVTSRHVGYVNTVGASSERVRHRGCQNR